MNCKDWLIIAVPKNNLREVARCLKGLRKDTYWGRTVEDMALLFLMDKPDQIRQIFLQLNLLRFELNLNIVFVNDFGLIG
jgi:hypothetical protein